MNTFRLLRDNRFWPLFYTQFLGAFNDNLFKNSLVILITFKAVRLFGQSSSTLVAMCGGIFILPFFLFSATAGQVADRYERSKLIRIIKVVEIFVMLIAAAGFFFGNISLLLLVLFLMGTQSAFFGPIKYSYLPGVLDGEDLVAGNALFQMGTFLAILLGTAIGGILISIDTYGDFFVGGAVVCFAIMGTWVSFFTKPLPVNDPNLKVEFNLIMPTIKIIKATRKNMVVFRSILGISWFWFIGAALLSLFPSYGRDVLHGDESVVTLLLSLFSIGIGAGSMLCKRLSGDKLELGLVPMGAIGLSLFTLDLFLVGYPDKNLQYSGMLMTIGEFFQSPGSWRVIFDLVGLALFGGFYIVPLMTLIQERSEKKFLSRIIAGNNIMNALGMVLSAGVLILFIKLKLTIPQVFLAISGLNLLVAIYIFTLIPEFFLRFIGWILARFIYRVQSAGGSNIPEQCAAVLVCNHVSFVDWLIITCCCRRPIRFVMHVSFFKIPFLGFLFRSAKTIPIASAKDNPELLKRAFDQIASELEAGELVCIFPEGKLTKDGEMNEFKQGIERIIERTPVPVLPMGICGMWESFLTRRAGSWWDRFPGKLFDEVHLHIGEPISPENVSSAGLFTSVKTIRCKGTHFR